jgi:hypothetical protein
MNYKSFLVSALICLVTLINGCSKEENESLSTKDTADKVPGDLSSGKDSGNIDNIIKTDNNIEQIKKPSKDTSKYKTDKNVNDTVSTKTENVELTAYYFHPTARCVTCRNIEAYSIEAIQEWELKTGKKVVWKELNIEDSANEHYAYEFNLEFSSLIVAKFDGGKREKWKNLNETWKLVNDKDSFKKYVIFELNQFIKNN